MVSTSPSKWEGADSSSAGPIMNKEVKAKWLKALRSGKYKQGKSMLHNIKNEKFCCLGVLCDLHSKETNDDWKPDLPYPEMLYSGTNSSYSIPKDSPVYLWSSLEQKEQGQLIDMNDQGKTFEQIADYIEENL